jgi:hypothetical protein
MQVNAERLDRALHQIPLAIKHLQDIELELMELRQSIIKSIEDEKKEDKNGR